MTKWQLERERHFEFIDLYESALKFTRTKKQAFEFANEEYAERYRHYRYSCYNSFVRSRLNSQRFERLNFSKRNQAQEFIDLYYEYYTYGKAKEAFDIATVVWIQRHGYKPYKDYDVFRTAKAQFMNKRKAA